MSDAVIIDVVRTAVAKGKPNGALAALHPVDLLAQTLRQLVERQSLDPRTIDDVLAGCVQQSGEQAGNIAHTAALAAGFPESVPGTTINRQCGSSQQAAVFAAQGVAAGAYDLVIACGVESMSAVPLGSAPAGRDNFGPTVRARYPEGLVRQGVSAELVAARWGLDRGDLDTFAAASHQRAAAAADRGWFDGQLVPIHVPGASAPHTTDETIRAGTNRASLASLRPAFHSDEHAARFPEIGWHVTPGNSSPLTDGASAVLIASRERAEQLGLEPRARFHASSVVGDDPLLMLTAPIPATRKVLDRAGLTVDDIDAFEVNEAFASVPLAWAKELHVDLDRVNPWGGAIALGHPLGSSGTRLLGTLVAHLEHTGGRYGLQTMCEAGGLANATIIERC
ncbi:thiolase family protein [Nitriliruptor alkaliphilus]|uniref:thiolase family protein n=1 Tax=Nitriliruptor alkaliphilus TaxID=427918 RepID=UPI0006974C0D|nr:thiolase family protein [Nitriliruptor alkaliphilus]